MTETDVDARSQLADVKLDDILPWVGVPYGGAQLKYQVAQQDFARWATHTDNYNPLHFDEDWAADSRHGEIVAPQSFVGIRGIGEETYTLSSQEIMPYHVADDFFFHGPGIRTGDRLTIDRSIAGLKSTNTRFGPSAFMDVDLTYGTAAGSVLRRRATTMFAPIENMVAIGDDLQPSSPVPPEAEWDEGQMTDIERIKLDYVKSIRTHDKRLFGSVSVGDTLPVTLIGPHTGTTFLYGETCGIDDTWGTVAHAPDNPPPLPVNSVIAGERPDRDTALVAESALLRPQSKGQFIMNDGRGGHIYSEAAVKTRGMPRAFAVGTMLSIWSVDYLSNWAGEWGFLRRSDIRYFSPVLSGDVTYLKGIVTELSPSTRSGHGQVSLSYEFTNQHGVRSCSGKGTVELPLA